MPSCLPNLGRWTSRHRGPYTAPGTSNHDLDVGWDSKIEGVAEFRSAELGAGHEETAERNANLALRNGINLHQSAKPIHVDAPPHWTTPLLQHAKRLSTASAKKPKGKPPFSFSTFRQDYLQLPLQLANRVAGLAKIFPEVSSPSSMPPRLPRSTWNYLSLSFCTVSHLEGLFPWRCVFWHSKCSCDIDGGNKCYNTFLPSIALLCDGWIFCCFYPWVILGGFLCFPAILWMRPNYDLLWSIDVAWMWSDFCCSAHRMKAHALFSTDLLLSWKQQGPD